MGQDGQIATDALVDLAHFEARYSGDGGLLHYARGRIRSFWVRQTLTAFGSMSIFFLSSHSLGLILAALALLGEVFDAVLLNRMIARLQAGKIDPLNLRIAVLGAAVQGATIAGCVVLCWEFVPENEARFFAAAFLIGAIINAGLGRPHFKPGADVRLLIFFVSGGAMLALDFYQMQPGSSHSYAYFAASVLILLYNSFLFIRVLERNYEQRRRHEFTLLTHQHAQELVHQRLAESDRASQRLALVAKYASDSILISDTDGRIEWVNDAFTRITGFTFDDAVGRHPSDFLNAPDTNPETLAQLQHSRETSSPVRAEILNNSKSGQPLWMEISVIPVLDDDGRLKLWIAVEREISQAKEREAELARARIAAEEAGQSKSRFLANMSHEIRTPMNGVIGMAELLADTRLSRTQADYVETIRESGKALLGVINDILDLAKLQSGKATLETLPFSPRTCIEGVLRILNPIATKKGLVLRLEDARPEGFVLGDEGKLRQILLNLVGNAVKFTQGGQVTVRLRLPSTDADQMEIAVADTGIGIAQDRIDAIFESFSQADNGIGRKFGGTGLGLTICAMLAEQMGGGITVQSTIGQGSVFTLRARLPLTGAEPSAQIPERRALPRLRDGLTVMVAEDNRTNMMIVRKMLAGPVPRLIEAVNGAEAVDLYMAAPPDLILMDLSMPLKDGLQATRDIRTHEGTMGWPACPIIALTANAFGEDREACRLAGMDGFLVKPLSRADLLHAISQHCPAPPPLAQAIGL